MFLKDVHNFAFGANSHFDALGRDDQFGRLYFQNISSVR